MSKIKYVLNDYFYALDSNYESFCETLIEIRDHHGILFSKLQCIYGYNQQIDRENFNDYDGMFEQCEKIDDEIYQNELENHCIHCNDIDYNCEQCNIKYELEKQFFIEN